MQMQWANLSFFHLYITIIICKMILPVFNLMLSMKEKGGNLYL